MSLHDFIQALEEAVRIIRPHRLSMQEIRFVVTDNRLSPYGPLARTRFDPITLVVLHQTGVVLTLVQSASRGAPMLGLGVRQVLDYIDAADNPARLPGALRASLAPIREAMLMAILTAEETGHADAQEDGLGDTP